MALAGGWGRPEPPDRRAGSRGRTRRGSASEAEARRTADSPTTNYKPAITLRCNDPSRPAPTAYSIAPGRTSSWLRSWQKIPRSPRAAIKVGRPAGKVPHPPEPRAAEDLRPAPIVATVCSLAISACTKHLLGDYSTKVTCNLKNRFGAVSSG